MQFPPSPLSALVDDEVAFDLGESTCPPLLLGDLLDEELTDQLAGTSLGYRSTMGDVELRRLLADSLGIGADQLLVTGGGGAAAMHLLAMVACDPGDEVVVATPCFAPSIAVPEALEARVRRLPLSFDTGYRLDLGRLDDLLSERTSLVSLCSPQNPSGISISEEEVHEVVAAVERRSPRAVVLVDETYRETWLGSGPVPPSVAGLSPRISVTSSLSKSHGAPGVRLGWVTAVDPDLLERLRVAKFNTQVCLSAADELIGIAILQRADTILAERRTLLRGTLGVLARWAEEHADLVDFLPPEGGALSSLRLRADRYDGDSVPGFYRALARLGVRVVPGSWFEEDDRVFRVGFGHLDAEVFPPALAALGQALRRSADRLASA